MPYIISSPKYKTTLCEHFTQHGYCKYGAKCQFAHGVHELRRTYSAVAAARAVAHAAQVPYQGGAADDYPPLPPPKQSDSLFAPHVMTEIFKLIDTV